MGVRFHPVSICAVENRKEKILDLAKDLAIRHYVSKDDPPKFLDWNGRNRKSRTRFVAPCGPGACKRRQTRYSTMLIMRSCFAGTDSIRSLSGHFPASHTWSTNSLGFQNGATLLPPSSLHTWRKTKLFIHKPLDQRRNIQIGGHITVTKGGGKNWICIPINDQ